MVNCRRCKRILKDPESIKKGIGPLCETRERAEQDDHVVLDRKDATVTDEKKATASLATYAHVVKTCDVICQCCGTPLTEGVVQSYDHEDGATLSGFGKPQWVYVRCRKCRYDTNYRKILDTIVKSHIATTEEP